MPSDFQSIVILTGAGISAESGLGTFRDEDGLWAKHRIEDVATPEGFARNPALVHNFYNERRTSLLNAVTNPAHDALGRLEQEHQGRVTIVTQNVDNLHEKGGSGRVLHMHGELGRVRCANCNMVSEYWGELSLDTKCDACHTRGMMRPHVVWFGEMPFYMDEIVEEIGRADLFVSIGTSGNVYPAAGFVMEARQRGVHTMELNLEPSEGAQIFHEGHYGPASKVVPAFVDFILSGTPMPASFGD